ncbi:PASTA domain-containing protein [Aromatoleum buckelii]|uniref:PASTA domain-containing protein n=1 Tax=Aromatoleum buckelii TaxID=200254 RepID=A0ABX1N3V0_9RHOO|nr:PASTA domain-containing protein [Aromatoleum buckelii]MCK0511472.1 PASTA domain-containing protein [Aromatoleum buckelii]
MPVIVPNVIGMSSLAAVAALGAVKLRHLGKLPFLATGDGTAATQDPPAGAEAPPFTVVTVSYPSPLGPMPDQNIEGPTLPAGTYDGEITRVSVGNPFGSGQGAWISFVTDMEDSPVEFDAALYFDHALHPAPVPDRIEWMRRGAMLGMAQRAFTHSHRVRLGISQQLFVHAIDILRT